MSDTAAKSGPMLAADGTPLKRSLARALRVQTGANAGDPLPAPADSVCGDYYRLDENAAPLTLMLDLDAPDGAGRLAPGSDLGHAGDPVRLEGRLSLMAPDGDLVEVLVLDLGTARVALPLSPLLARHVYTLIAADLSPGPIRLAAVVAGAFARGTRVALADGRQCAVEDLVPGDAVITRDHGAQVLRWKGAVTLRAEGGFAPVVVQPGVMGNPGPLAVSPHHRLFLYRRDARDLAGASGLLVQARHLVDDSAILRREGGLVTYVHILFDRHQIVYAEGCPSESLHPGHCALDALEQDSRDEVLTLFPDLAADPATYGPTAAAVLKGYQSTCLGRLSP